MKYIFLLSVLGVCNSLADYGNSREHWNHDIDSHAVSPCHHDTDCIRRYFAQHSHCRMSRGPVPDPLIIDHATLPFGVPNMTAIMSNIVVKGLNGKVTAFTINRATKKLVIAAEMKNLTVYDENLIYRYYRKGKEPIDLSDDFMIRYASVTFTATFPNYENLDISHADVFTYIEDCHPIYAIGPGLAKSFDHDVSASFRKLIVNILEVSKEAMIFLGRMMMLNYIEYNICDFGLHAYNHNQRSLENH